jgi:hypothetical protein
MMNPMNRYPAGTPRVCSSEYLLSASQSSLEEERIAQYSTELALSTPRAPREYPESTPRVPSRTP